MIMIIQVEWAPCHHCMARPEFRMERTDA